MRQDHLTFRELAIIYLCCVGLLMVTLASGDYLAGVIETEQAAALQEAGIQRNPTQ